MKLKIAFAFLSVFALSAPAVARDIDRIQLLTQSEFRGLSEDLGSALSYKPLTPTEPLGITGFDVGIAGTSTALQNKAALDRASGGDFPSRLIVPSVRFNKGLPGGFDFGLMAAASSGTDIGLWGGEVRYAIIKGSTALPAVGIRGSYTRVTGIDQLDLDTKGLDISVSKGLLMFTPYAGVGRVWVNSDPKGNGGLSKESFTQSKVFAGVNMNFALLNLALEADRTGEANTYGIKVGLRF
jgi:hypothetical protein